MEFGDRLRRAIEHAQTSQAELARAVGVVPGTIANYVANSREPDLTTLVRIAVALRIPVDDLLGQSDRVASAGQAACGAVNYPDSTDEADRFISLLRARVAEHGKSERRFEDDFGLPKWSLRGILDPKRNQVPSITKAKLICDALGWEYRLGPRQDAAPTESGSATDSDSAAIQVVNADASAGNGRVNCQPDQAAGTISFSRKWLLANGVSADTAKFVRVRGDSMAPTIPDGALALVQLNQTDLDREGIFAVIRDGLLLIKRLAPIAPRRRKGWTGTLILSDNPAYAPATLSGADQNEIRIIGRVRACFTTLS